MNDPRLSDAARPVYRVSAVFRRTWGCTRRRRATPPARGTLAALADIPASRRRHAPQAAI